MNEIAVLYILMAMANACIIWLLFERDRLSKRIIKTWSYAYDIKCYAASILDKHDKEIGEILAKLENWDSQNGARMDFNNLIDNRVWTLEKSRKSIEFVLETHLEAIEAIEANNLKVLDVWNSINTEKQNETTS